MIFTDLPLNKAIQQAIAEKGYTHPTPIQEKAIVIHEISNTANTAKKRQNFQKAQNAQRSRNSRRGRKR